MPRQNALQSICIINGVRTAIGSPLKSLRDFSAAQLGAIVIQSILKRHRIPKKLVEEVILGNAVSAGTGQNLSRQAAVLAGLPVTVPACTVNQVCGSGLQSVIVAAHSILCGARNLVVAGGTESASQSPCLYFDDSDDSSAGNKKVESLLHDGLWCKLTDRHMGHLAEYIVKEFKISRRKQDEYAFESHRKACLAQEEGKFLEEIAAVCISKTQYFQTDERPRKNINMEKLAALSPAFEKQGTVTAGNSSVPCDGAAAVVLAASALVKKWKLTARARILGYSSIAVSPREVFTAGVVAIRTCLSQCRLSLKDIDLFEISEAFSAQAILTQDKLQIPGEKINIWGGDIALGHPLGAAGSRGLVTLLHALRDRKKKKGIVCVCLGGGGAIALAVEII